MLGCRPRLELQSRLSPDSKPLLAVSIGPKLGQHSLLGRGLIPGSLRGALETDSQVPENPSSPRRWPAPNPALGQGSYQLAHAFRQQIVGFLKGPAHGPSPGCVERNYASSHESPIAHAKPAGGSVEDFGQDSAFLNQLAVLGLGNCAEVPHPTRTWRTCPPTQVPPPTGIVATPLLQARHSCRGHLAADFVPLRVAAPSESTGPRSVVANPLAPGDPDSQSLSVSCTGRHPTGGSAPPEPPHMGYADLTSLSGKRDAQEC